MIKVGFVSKRILVVLFVGMMMFAIAPALAMAESDESELCSAEIVIEYRFEKPSVEVIDGVAKISMPEVSSYGQAGKPVLPAKGVNILVPYGKEIARIEAHGNLRGIDGSYVVEWGQTPVPIGTTEYVFSDPDYGIYTSNDLYPGKLYEIAAVQNFRGYRIAVLNLYPVQYLPAEGKLYYYENMRLEVYTSVTTNFGTPLYRNLVADEEALSGMVSNSWTSGSYSNNAYSIGTGSRLSSLVNPADSYQYVIITTNALKPAFQSLLDWKQTRISTTIVAVEDIYAEPAYNGVDAPDEIRNFIKDAYLNWETDYVLLGGDDVDDSGNSIVPMRGVYLNAGGYSYNNVPCDMYFGALDGTWNPDGDEYWGEPEEIDYYPEVHVGRITADTSSEIQNWINKLLYYEQNPSAANLNQCVWIGEKLDSITYGDDSKDYIINVFPPDEYQFTKLYERQGTFSRSNVIKELNKGPHLVNHLGHANSGYVMGIYSSDVDALTNTEYFFAYSQGCMAGAFDQGYSGNSEAISEHFVYTAHGAFAVIMNARYGWYSPGSIWGPSQYFDLELFDALFTENIKNLGAANDDSKTDNAAAAQTDPYLRWCYLELNLHGDPQTPILEPVKYQHDIAVANLNVPDFIEPGTTYVEATIRNRGYSDESNIIIEFIVDSIVEQTQTISYLKSGDSKVVGFEWTPPEYPREYNIGIHAVPVPNENVTTNNLREKRVMVEYPPVADAGPDQDTFNYRAVTFDGSNSYDLDDGIVEYKWEFGDGASAYGMIVTHTYTSCQYFTARLTVKDHYGAPSTDTALITVWQRGHDMDVISIRSPTNARLGSTKTITVVVKNIGTYDDWPPYVTPDNPRSDWVLITLQMFKPDGTVGTQTKLVYLSQNIDTTQKFSVTLDQRGDWNFNVHVDISNSYGQINPFPRKDCHPENDDLEADHPTTVK